MATPWHVDLLRAGRLRWNAWRAEHPGVRPDLQLRLLHHLTPPLADLRAYDLRGADCTGTGFTQLDLTGADLRGASCERAGFSGARLNETTAAEAFFNAACLDGVTARRADFSGADFSDASLIQAALPEACLAAAILIRADLSEAEAVGAELEGANLRHACLRGSRFTDARFHGASLLEADLHRALLQRAQLHGADLRGVDLREADLSGADLSGADLRGADLSEARLQGAQLHQARFGGTIFSATFLGGAQGLAHSLHDGPSRLDQQTLEHQPPLPLPFLQGCGLQDTEITVAMAAAGQHTPGAAGDACAGHPIHAELRLPPMPGTRRHGYLIYADEDEAAAHKLFADLQRAGTRCWLHPASTLAHRDARPKPALTGHRDQLLFLISRHALTSPWLRPAVERAFDQERAENRALCYFLPIDNALHRDKTPWARRIKRHRALRDFSRWKHLPAYRKAIGELFIDLESPRFALP